MGSGLYSTSVAEIRYSIGFGEMGLFLREIFQKTKHYGYSINQ